MNTKFKVIFEMNDGKTLFADIKKKEVEETISFFEQTTDAQSIKVYQRTDKFFDLIFEKSKKIPMGFRKNA